MTWVIKTEEFYLGGFDPADTKPWWDQNRGNAARFSTLRKAKQARSLAKKNCYCPDARIVRLVPKRKTDTRKRELELAMSAGKTSEREAVVKYLERVAVACNSVAVRVLANDIRRGDHRK